MAFLRRVGLSLFVLLGLVGTSVALLDRPLSLQMETYHLQHRIYLQVFESIPVVVVPISVALFIACTILWVLEKHRAFAQGGLQFAVSVSTAMWIKDVLKKVFGRSWTRTWTYNNLSLARDGEYTFHWFNGNPQYSSFPSGHATAVAAAMVALMLAVPRLRWGCIAAIALTNMALLLQNFHFVGDLLAGTWLGTVVAACIWKIGLSDKASVREASLLVIDDRHKL